MRPEVATKIPAMMALVMTPEMLAPMATGMKPDAGTPVAPVLREDTTIPEGYVPETSNSICKFIPLPTDEDGFLDLHHDPIPVWTFFEQGEMATIPGSEVVAVNVPVRSPDGGESNLYFYPMYSATSTLFLYDFMYVFDMAEE